MKYKFQFPIRAITKDNFKGTTKYGRPFLHAKFKEFESNLRKHFYGQKPDNFKMFETEDLFVSLAYYFKDKRHADLSNLPKSTLDAFNGVIWKDDKMIKSLSLDLHYGMELIMLEVCPL